MIAYTVGKFIVSGGKQYKYAVTECLQALFAEHNTKYEHIQYLNKKLICFAITFLGLYTISSRTFYEGG